MNEILILEKFKDIVQALPSLVSEIVEGPDVCSSVFLLGLLLYLSQFMVATRPQTVVTGMRIGIGTAIVYVALVFWRFPPQTPGDLLVAILRSLITGGLFFATSCIAIPVLRFVWNCTFGLIIRTVLRFLRSCRRGVSGFFQRQAALFGEYRRQEGRFMTAEKRAQIELNERHRRENAARLAAEEAERRRRQAAADLQARQQKEQQQMNERNRREEAKLHCLLLYDRYSGALSKSFPRKRLEQYFEKYMTETHTADAVEMRATQLIGMLEELARDCGGRSRSRFQSLADIASFFEQQRQSIRTLPYHPDVIETFLVTLNEQEDEVIKDFLRTATQ